MQKKHAWTDAEFHQWHRNAGNEKSHTIKDVEFFQWAYGQNGYILEEMITWKQRQEYEVLENNLHFSVERSVATFPLPVLAPVIWASLLELVGEPQGKIEQVAPGATDNSSSR